MAIFNSYVCLPDGNNGQEWLNPSTIVSIKKNGLICFLDMFDPRCVSPSMVKCSGGKSAVFVSDLYNHK
jgi:hypothetical protein